MYEYSLITLIAVTSIFGALIYYINFFIGPKIGWTYTSHNTIIAVLFVLQFCVYPWYYRLVSSDASREDIDWINKNINDSYIILGLIILYLIYISLSLLLNKYKVSILLERKINKSIIINGKIIIRAFFLCYAFSIVLFIGFFLNLGGLLEFVQVLGSYRSGQITGTGVYTMPILVLCPIFAIILIDYLKNQKETKKLTVLVCILISIPPLLIGFRVSLVVFLFQVLYIYREKVEAKLYKIVTVVIAIIVTFSIYAHLRENLETGMIMISGTENKSINYFEPLFRSKSLDMLSLAVACGCRAENPLGFFIEPLSIYYNKIIGEEYFSYGEKFTQDILSGGVYMVNYGGINPNFVGFYYWLYGLIGLVIMLATMLIIDIFLKSVRNVKIGLMNVIGSIVYSLVPLAFDAPTAAYNYLFTASIALIISIGIILLLNKINLTKMVKNG